MPSWPEGATHRATALAAAGHNVTRLPAAAVAVDLATDAGRSYPPGPGRALDDAVRDAFGPRSWFATGSGRGAEAVVATLAGRGLRVVANEVYVSGAWWVERLGGSVEPVPGLGRDDGDPPGGLDDVAYVQITAPPARLGPDAGRPVTLGDLQRVRAWIDRTRPEVPLVVDGSRLWENAAAGGADVRAVAGLADLVLLSAGKDLGAAGGGLVVGRPGWWWPALEEAVATLEGLGGGRDAVDQAAMADGLDAAGRPGGAAARWAELDRLTRRLRAAGLAVASHGCGSVFLDARAWLPRVPADQLPAQTLLDLLYLRTGIRGLGTSTDEADSPPTVRLAVRDAAALVERVLPPVAAHGLELRSGLRPRARDRAAPYLQPARPVDPGSWPAPEVPPPTRPQPAWLVGRCPPGLGPHRALADAWGRARPGAELWSTDADLRRLHALLGGAPRAGRRSVVTAFPVGDLPPIAPVGGGAVSAEAGAGSTDLVVARLASPERWPASAAASPWVDAWWAATPAGGWVAVRRSSPLADALDQGALFTLGSWLEPDPG